MTIYMSDIVKMAWLRVGKRGSKFEFVCYCAVCSALRRKTKEPE